jgi:uncharacterized phage protein (TIGR01671 family)
MREIKLRAWNSNHGCWDYSVFEFNSDGKLVYPEGIHVMQFTGLFDKSGKEIWEGDIVRRTWRNCVGVNENMNGKSYDFNEEVKMTLGSWGLCVGERNCPFWFIGTQESGDFDFEVLGNIYENTELLKCAT